MRHNGWRGVMRARRPPRTTERDPVAGRAPDLVGRHFDLDDEGLVVLGSDAAESASLDDLRRAAYDCPTSSITVFE